MNKVDITINIIPSTKYSTKIVEATSEKKSLINQDGTTYTLCEEVYIPI